MKILMILNKNAFLKPALIACLVYFTMPVSGQDAPELSVENIPDSLLRGAEAVIRSSEDVFEVSSPSKAEYRFHTITTVLKEAGEAHLFYSEYTDKFRDLSDVEIKVYDKNGTMVSKAGRKQLNAQASGQGLVEDGMYLYYKVPANFYPITVSFKGTIRYKGTISYPSFWIETADVSVQKKSHTVWMPSGIQLRYKNQRTSIEPAISTEKDGKKYSWTVQNLPARKYQPMAVNATFRNPAVLMAPSKFELDGHAGDMSDWASFGRWIGDLHAKTNDLPEARKTFFRDMVKDAPDVRTKARLIYDYLQQNFRYVSIQLGIGGLRSFPASFTDAKKYGDCKALSTYMQSALDAVGVKSHQVIINADYNNGAVDPDFAMNRFNHMILCVPARDTIWLECTSNTTDFGKLGNFTENRNGMLVTEKGGVLVKTPESRSSDNIMQLTTEIRLSADDKSGTVKALMNGTGEFKEMMVSGFQHATEDDKKKLLLRELSIKQPQAFKAGLAGNPRAETVSLEVETSYDQLCAFSTGSKFFFDRHIQKQWIHNMPAAEGRTEDVYFLYPFIRTDSTIFHLPENFRPEALPEKTELRFSMGSYTSEMIFDEANRRVISISKLELKKHIIPAVMYPEAKIFFSQVGKDQGGKWVMVKQ